MSDCPRQGRLIGGCKFEARYDSELPEGFKLSSYEGSVAGAQALYDAVKTKTYVHDICTRCGKIVVRQ